MAIGACLFSAPTPTPIAQASEMAYCDFVLGIYARALVESRHDVLEEMGGEYWRCALDRLPPGMAGDDQALATIHYLQNLDRIGANVRFSSYDGAVELHPIIVTATGLILDEIPKRLPQARMGIWSSGVRTPAQQKKLLKHPVLGGQAILNSMHLGGMAADIAWPTRKASMAKIGAEIKALLKSKGYGNKVRVVIEPYCIHLELKPGLSKLHSETLYKNGVIKRLPSGHRPNFVDYYPAPEDGGFDPGA